MSSPVLPDWPDSLTIAPDPAAMGAHDTLPFTATGHYLDSSPSNDFTNLVVWTSSDITAATINSGSYDDYWQWHRSNAGLAAGVAAGVTTITATLTASHFGYPEADDQVATVALTVSEADPITDPEGRFLLAFDSTILTTNPTWTRLDDIPNLVTSYSIERGRQYELDRVDAGRATVQIIDTDGTLDPTNPAGPYYGKIQPLLQAAIGRRNPVTGEWSTRFRGFIENLDYTVDPSQQLNRLTISLVDLFDVLAAAEMQPGSFGQPPPEASRGQIYYGDQTVWGRLYDACRDIGLPQAFRALSEHNLVYLKPTVYSPGESVLTVLQEAADAEFPAVSQILCDRKGRICFRGRRGKFEPDAVAAEMGNQLWDYHEWTVGDGTAVSLSPSDTVQVREFAFDRGLSKIINFATATPAGIDDDDQINQTVVDTDSISLYGIRSWSAEGLQTDEGMLDSSDALTETKRFATFYVQNYATPQNRITAIGFRPLHPDDPRAPANWEFLTKVDIGDTVEVTVAAPGGGGFSSELYFVEGIHEQAGPLTPDYDDVTLRLDLSPRSYYDSNPWPES